MHAFHFENDACVCTAWEISQTRKPDAVATRKCTSKHGKHDPTVHSPRAMAPRICAYGTCRYCARDTSTFAVHTWDNVIVVVCCVMDGRVLPIFSTRSLDSNSCVCTIYVHTHKQDYLSILCTCTPPIQHFCVTRERIERWLLAE